MLALPINFKNHLISPRTNRKVLPRYPARAKLWDHNSGRYVHAQCLVTSHYVDPEKDYPMGLRQYFKHDSPEAEKYGFRTKIELAMELVAGVLQMMCFLVPLYLLFQVTGAL